MNLSKIGYVNKLNATMAEIYEQFDKSKIYSTSHVSYKSVAKQKHLHVFRKSFLIDWLSPFPFRKIFFNDKFCFFNFSK